MTPSRSRERRTRVRGAAARGMRAALNARCAAWTRGAAHVSLPNARRNVRPVVIPWRVRPARPKARPKTLPPAPRESSSIARSWEKSQPGATPNLCAKHPPADAALTQVPAHASPLSEAAHLVI